MVKDYSKLLEDAAWPNVQKTLLAGIRNERMSSQLSVVLENTRRALMADNQTQNMTYLPKLVLPLVRRLFPRLVANNIISVQSLKGPTGMIRYLDAYVVDTAGNKVNVYPFGPGDTGYSKPSTKVRDAVNTTVYTTVGDVDSKIDSVTQITENTNGTLSSKFSEGTLFLESSTVGSSTWTKFASVDRSGVVSKIGAGVVGGVSTVYGFVDPKTGEYVVTIQDANGNPLGDNYAVRWTYLADVQKNVLFSNTTDANGDVKNINTMQFDITRQNVEVITRKLGARYSFELMEDYKNEFGEDFEDKIVDYLTTTILTEIDGEVISMLSNGAQWSDTWSAKMPMTWTKGQKDWYETIMPKINKLSMTILQNTHVSGATFLLCNPTTSIVFSGMQQYVASGNPADMAMDVSAVKIGTLSNAYNVYVSPLVPAGEIIMGFKGSKPEETGAIYAPYIPVQLQPIAYAEGIPAVMARSRYWMGMLRPDYYGVLNVTDL